MKKNVHEYNGLGFPILLSDVKVQKTRYGEALDLNLVKLSDEVFKILIRKPGRFSGAEVKFIRHHMRQRQVAFADLLSVDQPIVSKWEAKGLESTEMLPAVELLLRIQMVRFIKQSIDKEISYIEPGIRKREVGGPISVEI